MSHFLSTIPLDVLVLSMSTYFAIIGPIEVGVVFGAISGDQSLKQRRLTAIRSTLIAMVILLLFSFFGQAILTNFGISMSALRISGGIMLLLVSIQMIFAQSSSATSTTDEEFEEAKRKTDITVFPLAIPLIAGPASMGGSILLMGQYQGDVASQAMVITGMFVVLFSTYIAMRATSQLQRFLGVTGINVIQRIFGVILSALAVQFILDGLAQSKIFN